MRIVATLIGGLALVACEQQPSEQPPEQAPGIEDIAGAEEQVTARAAADLEPQLGSNVRGSLAFVQQDDDVEVTAALTGAEQGEYRVVVHEGTACEDPGAPWSPEEAAAGAEDEAAAAEGVEGAEGGIEGDARDVEGIGEIEADEQGIARSTFTAQDLQLQGAQSVVGRVVTLHRQAEQADGAAAPAPQIVACGVIREGGATEAQPAGEAAPAAEEPAPEQ